MRKTSSTLPLAFGSLGIVFGDIGTSPLYAFKESLAAAAHHGALLPEMILGVLSLLLWTLILIVSVKYVLLLLRADNQGEGGILALMTLVQKAMKRDSAWVLLLGMAGMALFYGDAIITPAISVLSAVEGVKLLAPQASPLVMPLGLAVLVGLFLAQRHGTAQMARFFAPIMLLWFVALAWGGVMHITDSPEVWQAFDPRHAWFFITHHGWASVIAMGAVFLSVTGAEALYADMGHFGRKPIQRAWWVLVFPALMLNYMGQAAMVLANPEAAKQSFYLLYPEWALLPMVILAMAATVIASQSVISGAYSMSQQAVRLGLLQRLRIVHTSRTHIGQIYMPQVNTMLLIGVVLLILIFHTSTALAAAYGIAVTGTMVATSLLMVLLVRHHWHWSWGKTLLVFTPLLLIEAAFLIANSIKFFDGGYVPVLLSLVLMLMMRVWVRGSGTLLSQTHTYSHTLEALQRDIRHNPPTRIEGTAIFLTGSPTFAPSALLQNIKHNKVLHKQNLLLTIHFQQQPSVPDSERVRVTPLCRDFTQVDLFYGFMQSPNVIEALQKLRDFGIKCDLMGTSFFVSRRLIVPSANYGMPLWKDHIYINMANHASDAASYFHLPQSRVVEMGVQMTV